MKHILSRVLFRAPVAIASLLLLAGCGGSGSDGCPTCPDPVDDAALRLAIAFDDVARTGMEASGFRLADVDRVELVLGGAETIEREIAPGQEQAFFTLKPGSYVVAASAIGESEIVLFTGSTSVSVAPGDTAEATVEMEVELGVVNLEIGGQASGTVEAVGGPEGVPFTVTVRNTQGQPVPGSIVRLKTEGSEVARVIFDETNATDSQGRLSGVVQADHSTTVDLSLFVDDRPIPSSGPTRIEFATPVVAANSRITMVEPENRLLVADGEDRYTFEVEVGDRTGEPLRNVPVTPQSTRNLGLDPSVDIIEPAPGYEAGVTDRDGRFRFTVRTFSSSFLRLDDEGNLFSPPQAGFEPATIQVLADGVEIDRHHFTFNSTVFPGGGGLTVNGTFFAADGEDAAILTVTAEKMPRFGGGPARNVLVEITNILGEVVHESLGITPLPGFDGFRTNEQGVWRGRFTSTQADQFSFEVRVDGRALNLSAPVNVFFQ